MCIEWSPRDVNSTTIWANGSWSHGEEQYTLDLTRPPKKSIQIDKRNYRSFDVDVFNDDVGPTLHLSDFVDCCSNFKCERTGRFV